MNVTRAGFRKRKKETFVEDKRIIDLFWERNEDAVALAQAAYGSYCLSIARRVLRSDEDAEECVNDTLLAAWKQIPPERPDSLANFLGRIVRNIAIDRLRKETAKKRGGSEADIALEELEETLTAAGTPESVLEQKELAAAVSGILRGFPAAERNIFIRRYWFLDTVPEIASRYGISAGKAAMILSRGRKKLAAALKKKEWIE